MIQLTIDIPDTYKDKALTLIAFLQTLDYVTLSKTEKGTDFSLSEEQIETLEKIKKTPLDQYTTLENFTSNFEKKYGL
jgi:hypothetical protein